MIYNIKEREKNFYNVECKGNTTELIIISHLIIKIGKELPIMGFYYLFESDTLNITFYSNENELEYIEKFMSKINKILKEYRIFNDEVFNKIKEQNNLKGYADTIKS